MNFNLTEEQKLIRKTIREFCMKEIEPFAAKLDAECKFPYEILKKMAPLGFMGAAIPREYGGAGVDAVSYAIILEEVSRSCASTGITLVAHSSLCLNHLYTFGNEVQKQNYVMPLAQGKKIGAWAVTEPSAGSDVAAIKTTAKMDGDCWVLNGTKQFITNGSVADIVVVLAVTSPGAGHKGLSAFVVEKGTPGFRAGVDEKKLGLRASVTSELIFEDCRIPNENLVGVKDRAFYDVMQVLDGGRIGIAAMAVGVGQACLDASIKYSKEREQFGQKICEFQAIQRFLVDMAVEIEAARLLTYKSAWLKDNNMEFGKLSAMAKLFASEAGMRAAVKAVQIHGGIGYTKDSPVERYMRDIKLCEIGEGTSEIQRMVISRRLGLR